MGPTSLPNWTSSRGTIKFCSNHMMHTKPHSALTKAIWIYGDTLRLHQRCGDISSTPRCVHCRFPVAPRTEVLVKWQHVSSFEATWEEFHSIQLRFPHFHLEYKVSVSARGNATNQPRPPILLIYHRRGKKSLKEKEENLRSCREYQRMSGYIQKSHRMSVSFSHVRRNESCSWLYIEARW